jgi:hypothetical protein
VGDDDDERRMTHFYRRFVVVSDRFDELELTNSSHFVIIGKQASFPRLLPIPSLHVLGPFRGPEGQTNNLERLTERSEVSPARRDERARGWVGA